jgi:hypothetical protein
MSNINRCVKKFSVFDDDKNTTSSTDGSASAIRALRELKSRLVERVVPPAPALPPLNVDLDQFKAQVIKTVVPVAPPLGALASPPSTEKVVAVTQQQQRADTDDEHKKRVAVNTAASSTANPAVKNPTATANASSNTFADVGVKSERLRRGNNSLGPCLGPCEVEVDAEIAYRYSQSLLSCNDGRCKKSHDRADIVERAKHFIRIEKVPNYHCPLKWLTSYCPDHDDDEKHHSRSHGDRKKCPYKIHKLSPKSVRLRDQVLYKLDSVFCDERGCRAQDGEYHNSEHSSNEKCDVCDRDHHRDRDRRNSSHSYCDDRRNDHGSGVDRDNRDDRRNRNRNFRERERDRDYGHRDRYHDRDRYDRERDRDGGHGHRDRGSNGERDRSRSPLRRNHEISYSAAAAEHPASTPSIQQPMYSTASIQQPMMGAEMMTPEMFAFLQMQTQLQAQLQAQMQLQVANGTFTVPSHAAVPVYAVADLNIVPAVAAPGQSYWI